MTNLIINIYHFLHIQLYLRIESAKKDKPPIQKEQVKIYCSDPAKHLAENKRKRDGSPVQIY